MNHDRDIPDVPVLPGSEALASLRKGDLRWIYDSGFHDRLFGPSAPDWNHLDQCPNAFLIKSNPQRQIYRVEAGSIAVYVKLYRINTWQDRLKWEFRRCPARIEFQRCLLAAERHVPAPRALGWAQGPRHALLLLPALPEGFTLEQFLWDDAYESWRNDPQKIRTILQAAGKIAGQMHAGRLLHDDFHFGNIHLSLANLDTPRAWLIDLYKLRPSKSEGALSALHPEAVNNMARLFSGLSLRFSADQMAPLIDTYLKTIQPHQQWTLSQAQDYQRRLTQAMDRLRAKLQSKYDRRCLRDSRYTRKVHPAPGWEARVFLQHKRPLDFSAGSREIFTPEQWTRALQIMLSNYSQGRGLLPDEEMVRLQPKHQITTASLNVNGHPLPVKIHYYSTSNLIDKLTYSAGRSPARHGWFESWYAIHRYQPTPWPLAVLHHRYHGMTNKAILICHDDQSETVAFERRDYRSILIVKPSSLGDVVRCLPIYYGLRQAYPRAEIAWLINTTFAELLTNIDGLKVIEFHRKHYGRMTKSLTSLRDFLEFGKELRQRRFDLVVDLQGLFRSGLIARLSGAPVRIGFEYAREAAPLFYTHTVTRDESRIRHVVDDNWAISFPLGFHRQTMSFEIPIDNKAWQSARHKANETTGSPLPEQYAVLLCGGSAPSKRWPPACFAQLAQALFQHYQLTPIILGAGATEEGLASQIMDSCGPAAGLINLTGRTNLLEMTELLRHAHMIIGNDSGPLHIAAALGRPTIGIYGPTNPAKVGPYGQIDHVVAAGKEVDRVGRYSKHESHRIESIPVDAVLNQVQAVMEKIDSSDHAR